MYVMQQQVEPVGYMSPQEQVFNVIYTDQHGQPLQIQIQNMQLHSIQQMQFQQLPQQMQQMQQVQQVPQVQQVQQQIQQA